MGGVTIVSRGVPDDRESRAAGNIHDSKANHTCENHAKGVPCGSFAEGRFGVARGAPSVLLAARPAAAQESALEKGPPPPYTEPAPPPAPAEPTYDPLRADTRVGIGTF